MPSLPESGRAALRCPHAKTMTTSDTLLSHAPATPVQLHRPARTPAPAAGAWSVEAVQELLDLPFMELLWRAQSVHRQHWPAGDVELATLLSVKTGGCPENCGYCPQSAEFDTGVKAQKLMSVEEVTTAARAARDAGATRFCMGAAWRAPKDRDIEKVGELIAAVKGLGMQTCATLGMLEPHQAQALKGAGLDYYNHNLDTAPEYYTNVVSTRASARPATPPSAKIRTVSVSNWRTRRRRPAPTAVRTAIS